MANAQAADTQLTQRWTDVDGIILEAILTGDWPSLKELDLSYDPFLNLSAMLTLGYSTWSQQLKRLLLADTRLGDDGLINLVKGQWCSLEHLDLSANKFGETDFLTFTDHFSSKFPSVKSLELSGNAMNPLCGFRLAARALPQLNYIGLRETDLDASALQILMLGSESFPLLETIDLSDNAFTSSECSLALFGRLGHPPLIQGINYLQKSMGLPQDKVPRLIKVDLTKHDAGVRRNTALVEGLDVEFVDAYGNPLVEGLDEEGF